MSQVLQDRLGWLAFLVQLTLLGQVALDGAGSARDATRSQGLALALGNTVAALTTIDTGTKGVPEGTLTATTSGLSIVKAHGASVTATFGVASATDGSSAACPLSTAITSA